MLDSPVGCGNVFARDLRPEFAVLREHDQVRGGSREERSHSHRGLAGQRGQS